MKQTVVVGAMIVDFAAIWAKWHPCKVVEEGCGIDGGCYKCYRPRVFGRQSREGRQSCPHTVTTCNTLVLAIQCCIPSTDLVQQSMAAALESPRFICRILSDIHLMFSTLIGLNVQHRRSVCVILSMRFPSSTALS